MTPLPATREQEQQEKKIAAARRNRSGRA